MIEARRTGRGAGVTSRLGWRSASGRIATEMHDIVLAYESGPGHARSVSRPHGPCGAGRVVLADGRRIGANGDDTLAYALAS